MNFICISAMTAELVGEEIEFDFTFLLQTLCQFALSLPTYCLRHLYKVCVCVRGEECFSQ